MEFFKIMKLLNKKFYMILLVFVGLIFSGAIFISTYPSPGENQPHKNQQNHIEFVGFCGDDFLWCDIYLYVPLSRRYFG